DRLAVHVLPRREGLVVVAHHVAVAVGDLIEEPGHLAGVGGALVAPQARGVAGAVAVLGAVAGDDQPGGRIAASPGVAGVVGDRHDGGVVVRVEQVRQRGGGELLLVLADRDGAGVAGVALDRGADRVAREVLGDGRRPGAVPLVERDRRQRQVPADAGGADPAVARVGQRELGRERADAGGDLQRDAVDEGAGAGHRALVGRLVVRLRRRVRRARRRAL